MPRSSITTDTPLTTLVNVSVDSADQQRLIERWQQATEQIIRQLPGFLSANTRRSLDGPRVAGLSWPLSISPTAVRLTTTVHTGSM